MSHDLALFAGLDLGPRLSWWNPPAAWSVAPSGGLIIQPDAKTDFWRTTHYGYDTDNGHCLFAEVAGDFVLTTTVRVLPQHRYDQAGLMVRLSRDCWLKASVEYDLNGPVLGAVVTNHGYSDWSNQNLTAGEIHLSLRVRREGDAYFVVYRLSPDDPWNMIRLTHLAEDDGARPVQCGLYACSPIEAGCEVHFESLRIESGRVADGE